MTIDIATTACSSGTNPFTFPARSTLTARTPRRRLAAALSLALLATSTVDSAWAATKSVDATTAAVPLGKAPHAPPQNWPVQTCDDTTVPGSLRYIASHAQSGDTIDFSQLPQLPTLCSTITLSAGEIVLHQPEIRLIGPVPGAGTVTLSGGGQSRVLRHQMYSPFNGTLHVDDLRIVDGYADASASIGGGCIYSDASIYLNRSVIEGCVAHSSTGSALGGGLHTPTGTISLVSSKVSGNTVTVDTTGNANGGGSSSRTLIAKYSEIVGNSAHSAANANCHGGGAYASIISIGYSTVAGNASETLGGGLYAASPADDVIVGNSTFSGNHSHSRGGAISAQANNLRILNSTIASNSTDYDVSAGIYFNGTTATIESTIIASNTSAAMASGTDFYIKSGTLTGANNAIMSSNDNTPGVIVLTEDPQLAPLAWIGGPTRSMDLRSGSPAIGIGSNTSNRNFDQRGSDFPRATGQPVAVDIGAVQSTDRIFVSDLDRFFL